MFFSTGHPSKGSFRSGSERPSRLVLVMEGFLDPSTRRDALFKYQSGMGVAGNPDSTCKLNEVND
jgi:hypothetical protein